MKFGHFYRCFDTELFSEDVFLLNYFNTFGIPLKFKNLNLTY